MNISTVKTYRPIPVEGFRGLESAFQVGKNCSSITIKEGNLIVIDLGKHGLVGVGIGNVEFFRFAEESKSKEAPKPAAPKRAKKVKSDKQAIPEDWI